MIWGWDTGWFWAIVTITIIGAACTAWGIHHEHKQGKKIPLYAWLAIIGGALGSAVAIVGNIATAKSDSEEQAVVCDIQNSVNDLSSVATTINQLQDEVRLQQNELDSMQHSTLNGIGMQRMALDSMQRRTLAGMADLNAQQRYQFKESQAWLSQLLDRSEKANAESDKEFKRLLLGLDKGTLSFTVSVDVDSVPELKRMLWNGPKGMFPEVHEPKRIHTDDTLMMALDKMYDGNGIVYPYVYASIEVYHDTSEESKPLIDFEYKVRAPEEVSLWVIGRRLVWLYTINGASDNYDGEHPMCSAEEFKGNYMQINLFVAQFISDRAYFHFVAEIGDNLIATWSDRLSLRIPRDAGRSYEPTDTYNTGYGHEQVWQVKVLDYRMFTVSGIDARPMNLIKEPNGTAALPRWRH